MLLLVLVTAIARADESGVEILGVNLSGWNDIRSDVKVKVRQAKFTRTHRAISNDAAGGSDLMISVNGELLGPTKTMILDPRTVVLRGVPWKEGKNTLEVLAAGEYMKPGRDSGALTVELYMGSRTLNFEVVDENGRPSDAPVTLTFRGTGGFTIELKPKSGKLAVPFVADADTFFVHARDGRNYMSHVEGISMPTFKGGTVKLKLRGFGEPSKVDNNDFSKGLEGWSGDMDSVKIVPHEE
jgi:hypothetical protein